MLNRIFRLLLGLYPAAYRSTFGREMASVFQLAQADACARGFVRGFAFCAREFGGLALGAVHAWARQSDVRAEPSLTPAPDGVPTFHTCEDYFPRRSALIEGGILTLAFFSAVTAAFEYGVNHRIFRLPMGSGQEAVASQFIETGEATLSAFGKSMVSSDSAPVVPGLGKQPAISAIDVRLAARSLGEAWSNLARLLRVRPQIRLVTPAAMPATELRGFEAAYFRTMPVVAALDADHNGVISAAEIANAPAVLRSLDANHDGKLSAEECGALASAGSNAALAYMRFHPVLAALDADHDGEISAQEIENAPAALKTLDRNHDGKLTIDEIVPKAGVPVQ